MANNLNNADIRIITDGLAPLRPPTLSQSVHREECTQCFDNQVRIQSRINIIEFRATRTRSLCLSQDDPEGIDVCLTCFNGGCVSEERHHAYTHYKKTGHAFALNVKRRARPRPKRVSDHQACPLAPLLHENRWY